jgi:SAM-dependent methyltransferase
MGAAVKVDVGKRRELLLGCGSNRIKKVSAGNGHEWSNLTTLDFNGDHRPDFKWDLENLPLPFEDESFDEIHAYDVLEHLRSQGDWQGFFADFSEYWRLLRPTGVIVGLTPMWNSPWAWGDPSHRRIIGLEQFTFLDQSEYTKQVGKTPMSDFRFCYQADFTLAWSKVEGDSLAFILQAVKPSRIEVKP